MQKIFGITGIMGTGKSTFSKNLSNVWPTPLMIIEVDELRQQILYSGSKDYSELRAKIGEYLKIKTFGKYHILNRIEFTNKLFASKETVNLFNELTTPYFKKRILEIIKSTEHDCLIAWSHIIENNYDELFNGPIIYIYTDPETHQNRINQFKKIGDGLPYDYIIQRLSVCSTQEEKLSLLKIKENYIIFNSEKEQDFKKNSELILKKFNF